MSGKRGGRESALVIFDEVADFTEEDYERVKAAMASSEPPRDHRCDPEAPCPWWGHKPPEEAP